MTKILTVREFAAQIRTSEATVRRWIREGRLRGVMPGGRRTGYRIPSSEVDRLLGMAPTLYGMPVVTDDTLPHGSLTLGDWARQQ
jgi:excisionase family DNA binding protein